MQINVELPAKLGQIFEGEADYRGAYGGRGAAKTIGFAKMAVVEMLSLYEGKPWKFLCGRELQKSLKDSVHSVIAAQITELGLDDYFDVGREYIRAKNGNEFLFYGLKTNIAEIKSLHNVRRTWLEEAQKVSKTSLEYLVPTVMRDFPDCEIWSSWNPEDEDDPIHEMFVLNADSRTKVVKINWSDNPWFPEGLDKVRLRDLKNNPERYNWIWEGGFNVNADGAVYAKWLQRAVDEGRVRKNLFDPSLSVFTGWDLGWTDDTAIWWFQVAGNEVRLIDYYENNRQDMKHYAEQIYGRSIVDVKYGENGKVLSYSLGGLIEGIEHRAEYKYGDMYVPHDAANKILQAGGRSAIDQLHELGIKSRIVHATSQQNQISAARATINFSWFDEERCKQGMRCLRKYAFEERPDDKGYSHNPKHDIYSHGCFVGSTQVLTLSGLCAIMDLPLTGKVLTEQGWKTYINPHITRKNANLVEVSFTDGLIVKCTPDHLFMTESGWKSAESLIKGMQIQSSLTKERKPSMGRGINSGLAKDTWQEKRLPVLMSHTIGAKGFIEKFGSVLSEKYRMTATYITKMVTRLTTPCPILSACNRMSILGLHGKKLATSGRQFGLPKKPEQRLLSGTSRKRAGLGTESIPMWKQLLGELTKIACGAERSFRGYLGQTPKQTKSIAPRNAKTLRVQSVRVIDEKQDVWCMTVPDIGHFSLANGAIVKNCDAYEILAQVWKSAKVDATPPKPRFLHEMTIDELFYSSTSTGNNRI